jgi:type III secretion system low calcium response chaperone LcrH/SycD
MQTGVIPKDKLGYSDEKIEALYGQAYRLYNTGKYQDAIQIFRMLIILNPPQGKYMLGLAACFHMLKDWENAIKVYTICSIVDSENPIPLFHASDCYIQMRDRASAIIALEMAIQRAKDKQEYQILKDRSLLTIASLKKELAQAMGG